MAKRNYIPRQPKGHAAPKDGDVEFHDLGFSTSTIKNRKRFVNKDGSFNVLRSVGIVRDLHVYHSLVSMKWSSFMGVTLLFYFMINCFFALLYLLNGIEYLGGAEEDGVNAFWTAFFFSVQTLTTVGYGSVSPMGFVANLIAAMGALTGLMVFALATGLLFARFSMPSASILFSENAIIAPYNEGKALMFRLANKRRNMLTNLHIEVIAAWVGRDKSGREKRIYRPLELERDKLTMLPLSWTVVHPLEEDSPITICAKNGCDKVDLELIVILEGYDDTFANIIRAHSSYKYNEIIWNAKFDPAFYFNEYGDTVLELDKLNQFTLID
ncbi:ion channel [Aureispira anguillae]|uniref:Ion channel n=1 Tax=Aureispira anguillae TaxID=2864201 RepID=A0A915YGQ5_9BACT|nr:ion channel [Aureispira anguillae]BDS12838.1 ion channel [Aureispira anguillae]